MGELDRNVGRQFAALNLFVDTEVMIANRGCFGAIGDLLAQLGEHRAEADFGELTRCFECGVERFARHEALHGTLEEASLAQLAGEPLAARGFEEEAACESHAEIV